MNSYNTNGSFVCLITKQNKENWFLYIVDILKSVIQKHERHRYCLLSSTTILVFKAL